MGTDKRSTAPLYDGLMHLEAEGKKSFHVPGHKYGAAYREAGFAPNLLQTAMRIDVTEITGTDDLHHPEGIIAEAQALAADCFGAEESYFLVGGSTSGNLAMILTVCREPGMKLIVQRNVHKSVIHGLMLAGAAAVFVEPRIDPASGLAVAPPAEAVRAALAAHPEAAGVLVTMPNYYGMGSDLAPLASVCHAAGVPLLVDEAHGAHYGLHPALPKGALAQGADGVVQSTHKMLGALTMGAMLHVQGPRLDRGLLRQRLAMVQSSSPSYPVMASLDLARRQVHSRGPGAFTAGLAAVEHLRRGLAGLPRFALLQPAPPLQRHGGAAHAAATDTPPVPEAAYSAQDPFKAVLYDGSGVLGGFELARRLEDKGCVPEMSDDRHVVLLFSLGSRLEDAEALMAALAAIDREAPASAPAAVRPPATAAGISAGRAVPYSPPVPFSLKPVPAAECRRVPLAEAEGFTAAEIVIPYPPGIPLLYPGEVITGQVKRRLAALAEAGAKFQGIPGGKLDDIRIYDMQKDGGT